MIELTTTIAAYVCLATLLYAGLSHALSPARLRDALGAHAIWPPSVLSAVVVAIVALELGIGGFGLGAVLASPGEEVLLQLSLVCASGLYGAYAVYSQYILRRRGYVPCGCSGSEEPVNVWVVARAAALALGALGASLATDRLIGVAPVDEPLILALLASFALGVILWNLPGALHDPGHSLASADRVAHR